MKYLFVAVFLFCFPALAQITEPYYNCQKWQRTSDATFSCVSYVLTPILGKNIQNRLETIHQRLSKLEAADPATTPALPEIEFTSVYNCRDWIKKNGFYKCGATPYPHFLISVQSLTEAFSGLEARLKLLENNSLPTPSFSVETLTFCRPWASIGGSFVCRTPAVEQEVVVPEDALSVIYNFESRLSALENP